MQKKFLISFILILVTVLGIVSIAAADEWDDLDNKRLIAVKAEDYKSAIAILNRMMELQPDNAEVYFKRGMSYRSIHNPQSAVSDLNKAIELGLNSRAVYFLRGSAYGEMKDFNNALADFDTALKIPFDGKMSDVRDALIYVSKAMAYVHQNNVAAAKENANLALKVAQPGDPATALARDILNVLNKLNTSTSNAGSTSKMSTTMTVKPDVGNATMNQLLIQGVHNGDLSMVQTAVAKGANVNIYSSDYCNGTPLTMAVDKNNLEIVNYLISQGANVNVKTDRCNPPLYVAVKSADINFMPLMDTLINAGANAMTVDSSGNNLIYVTCDNWTGSEEWRIQMVQYLLKCGVNINQQGYRGDTPLILAVGKSMPRLVQFLLANGANPAIKNQSGETALMKAITSNKKELIDILLPVTPN